MAKKDQTLDVFNWLVLSSANKLPNPQHPTNRVLASRSHDYDLYSRTVKEALRYGERIWGINLVWGDPGDANSIRFERKEGGASGEIKSDELIAIHVKGGSFLKYEEREYGINIVWSDTPSFEWKLVFPKSGDPIATGTPCGIFNTTVKDFLFYDPRTYGINLKWLRDKGKHNEAWYENLVGSVVDVVKNTTVLGLIERLTKAA